MEDRDVAVLTDGPRPRAARTSYFTPIRFRRSRTFVSRVVKSLRAKNRLSHVAIRCEVPFQRSSCSRPNIDVQKLNVRAATLALAPDWA
jgi:hypothetical protein